MFKNILIGLAIILTVLLVGFGMQALSYGSFKFWAPKIENVKREVFENTKSYKHGTIRDLQNLVLEYEGANNEGHRQALKAVILHRSATFDETELTPQLRRFLANL